MSEENRKLKTMVADLSLDKHILQDVLSKKAEARAEILSWVNSVSACE